MTLQLRPANLGEILDRTASLYRARFWVFVGIAAVPAGGVLFFAAAVFLLSARIGPADPATAAVLGMALVGMLLLAIPVCLALTALGNGAISHAASEEFLGGRATIRGAYRATWGRGWRYIGLMAMQMIFLAIIPLAAWVVVFGVLAVWAAMSRQAAATLSGDWANLTGALLLIVGVGLVAYFFWTLMRLCLAFSASVVEQAGAWASLKRAAVLSKGTRGRILVLYLLCAAMSWIVSMVLIVPFIIGLSLIPQLNTPQHQQTMGALFLFMVYAASFASQAFVKPVTGIALMIFYYDQRIRKEGFDIEWMMREAGMEAVAEAPGAWHPAEGAPSRGRDSQALEQTARGEAL